MADAPSWLDSEEPNGPSAPHSATLQAASRSKASALDENGNFTIDATGSVPNGSAPAAGSMLSTTTPSSGVDDKDLPRVVLLMRLANLGAAGALIAVSIVMMVGLPGISTWVLSIYATCGGLLICCLETQLKFLRAIIALNFGFLFSAPLRFLFYLLLAAIAWTYGKIFGPVVAAAMAAVALFNTYVLCRYPTYRKMREKIAEEEDKRIEAKVSGEVKKQAINSLRR